MARRHPRRMMRGRGPDREPRSGTTTTPRRTPASSHASDMSTSGHQTKESGRMTETVDELGPVDWIVVEFPGSKFNGEIAPALRDLVQRRLIRVLDLLVLKKEEDGSLEAFELSDLGPTEV